ncbi:MAG: hypothetical protein RL748_4203 [Pseudomonadota bacterium]
MRALRTPFRFNPARYGPERLQKMQQGGRMLLEAQRALAQRGQTVLSKVGPKDGKFSLWDHYPADEVSDRERGFHYYYHSHRITAQEHGHFHLYAMLHADGSAPTPDNPLAEGEGPSHLLAIAVDPQGLPTRIFSANQWVTQGHWLPAETLLPRLENFGIDNARHWAQVTRWLSGFVQLFWPQIETLLKARDVQVAEWRGDTDWEKFWNDQSVEILNYIPLDLERQLALVQGGE